jgi:hypothetical protein
MVAKEMQFEKYAFRHYSNTTGFTWHFGAIFVLILIGLSITGWLYKRKNSDSCKYTPLENGIVDTVVFGLTQMGLEPTIYRTWDELAIA